MRSGLLAMVWTFAVCVACGDDGSGDSPRADGGATGSGGSTSNPTSDPFPGLPECATEGISVSGKIAGEDYRGGSNPSNWKPVSITFGVGETSGSMFGNEGELRFAEELAPGERVPIDSGYLYVHAPHSLGGQYICVHSGEIALVSASAEGVLIEFVVSEAAMGQYCEGDAVDVDLHGCIARSSGYVP